MRFIFIKGGPPATREFLDDLDCACEAIPSKDGAALVRNHITTAEQLCTATCLKPKAVATFSNNIHQQDSLISNETRHGKRRIY